MKFRIGGAYDIGVEGFWNSVFFEPAFNDYLYLIGLGFHGYDILEETISEHGRTRLMKVFPNVPIPGAVRTVLGDKIYYLERGEYDAAASRFTTLVTLPAVGSKVAVGSVMTFHPDGEGRSRRSVAFEVKVKLFGVGRVFERFIEKTLRESYETARVHTNLWIETNVP